MREEKKWRSETKRRREGKCNGRLIDAGAQRGDLLNAAIQRLAQLRRGGGVLRLLDESPELVVDNHASKRIKDGHAALPLPESK